MNWNHWIRQFHRWMSILFTLVVIANFVALGIGQTMLWLTYLPLLPLLPLALLMLSGLTMFALPTVARARRA